MVTNKREFTGYGGFSVALMLTDNHMTAVQGYMAANSELRRSKLAMETAEKAKSEADKLHAAATEQMAKATASYTKAYNVIKETF